MNGASAIHLSIFGMNPVVKHGSPAMQAEAIREPVGKIVGAELKPQARRDEVEIETGMAER
jgi:acyl-CoA dehydrogenase